jgi:phage-related tail fiber protein
MSNEILKFCETDTGTNLLTEAAYLADAQRLIGNQPGIARAQLVNKALRQSTFITKVFADYLVQQTGSSVLDDSNDSNLLAIFTNCFATGLPIASVINMLTSVVPTGFLKANGAAVSRTTYAALFNVLVTVPGFTSQSFTVTIASPAVVTHAGHGFVGGERLRLSTSGFLPTGLSTSTDYYVFYIDANTFKLQTISDVLAGTFANTSGVQGGAHTYQRSLWGLGDGTTTFNVPDLRGAFNRSWDDSRGLDPARDIASLQLDAFQGHYHQSAGGGAPIGGGSDGRYTTSTDAGWSNNPANAVRLPQTDGVNGTPRTAAETRPINYALMPVIKY